MILGDYNELKVVSESPMGYYLEDEDGEQVLLPTKWIPSGLRMGDDLKVFIYLDSEERPIATTMIPKITLHSFAYLRVKQVSSVGAFLDWGLEKDLFVPFIEQEKRMLEGQKYVVYMYKDEMTQRLTASSRISSYLEKDEIKLQEGQRVNILVSRATDLGFNVIVDNQYEGLIYKNEIFRKLRVGDQTEAWVKTLRPDHKIDISLEKAGYANVEPNAHKVLLQLRKNDGYLNLNDKSDPEEISSRLEMSKKTFKKAIGSLYKQRIISIEEDGIHLL